MDRRTAIKAAVAGVAGACLAPLVGTEPIKVSQQLLERETAELWCEMTWLQEGQNRSMFVKVEGNNLAKLADEIAPWSEKTMRLFYKSVPQWIVVETYRA